MDYAHRRTVFAPANHGLRHLAVEAIGYFLRGLHIASDCRCYEDCSDAIEFGLPLRGIIDLALHSDP